MSTFPTDAERDAAADALRKSRLTWGTHSDRWSDAPWQRDFWGEAADVALAAPAPLVADRERAAAARALREAADEARRIFDTRRTLGMATDNWLRARADALEAGEEPPACGHVQLTRGCGGCDPSAIEFIKDDGGPWVRVAEAGEDA